MEFSKREVDVALYAHNLDISSEVKESLEMLVQMDITIKDLKLHNLMNLAMKFMLKEGVKDAARKLIAKIRRMESSGSPTEVTNRKRSRQSTPEDNMMSSKKTAPVKYEGKKKSSDTAPSEMSLQQLQEYVAANPNLAASVDPHFQKFVSRDFPLASRYPKPSFMTWKQIYEQFASLSTPREDKEVEDKKKKQSEDDDDKLKAFLERKKATAVRKIIKKPLLVEPAPMKPAKKSRRQL